MGKVLIYRHQLFKPSEVFISQQAGAMKKFQPVFVGRTVHGEAPAKADVETLQSAGRMAVYRNVFFRDSRALVNPLRGYNPQIIHAHFGFEGVYSLGLARALRAPLVTTFHGVDVTSTSGALIRSCKPAWINYLLFRKKLARSGDLFICVSDFIRQQALKLGFPEDRTVTHYIGIDSDNVQPDATKKTSKIILHVARLVEKKGTKYLIDAFSSLAKKDAEAELVIVGDGPLRNELEAYVKFLGIANRVQFLGVQHHSSVLDWMDKSSVFCLPSITARSGDSEGLGMVFLEAAAKAVPTVATHHGGIPEAVDDGVTGFLVPERDPDALADRLEFLLQNEGKRQEMGQAGRRMIKEKFCLNRQTAKLEDIYEALL